MKTIFHGGTEIVERPRVDVGREGLDFGRGFYATERMEQARSWADRNSRQRLISPVVNEYFFDDSKAKEGFKFRVFAEYNIEWLDFIVRCRGGYDPSSEYDYIEGGVANDRVIDTVEGYINGTIDAGHALIELSKHQPNHQICFLNQEVIEKCVIFMKAI